MNMESIETLVKGDFAGILTFKRRGETLEVITPYAMSNNDVVSVFVTERDGEFVCTVEIGKEMRDRAGRKAWNALLKKFGVKKNLDTDWFYKKTDNPKCVGSCIYDLANYAMAVSYVMYGVPRPCNFDRYHSAKQFLSDYCDDSMLEFCQIVWEDRVQGALDGVASDFIRAIEYLFMKNLNEKGGPS